MRNILLVFIVIACISCDQLKGDNSEKVRYYYPVDSLLAVQKQYLVESKASVEKWAFVDQDTAQSSYQPDSLEWKNELGFFERININKPALKTAYLVETIDDKQSNLKIKSYESKKPDQQEIQYLKLYYLDDLENLKKLEAYYTEDNPIYSSTRILTMEFEKKADQLVLKNYLIEGGQKMILKDTVQFKIIGKIK